MELFLQKWLTTFRSCYWLVASSFYCILQEVSFAITPPTIKLVKLAEPMQIKEVHQK